MTTRHAASDTSAGVNAKGDRSLVTRRLAAVVGVLIAAAAALITLSPSASAHAMVASATPANGAELDRAPQTVSITFDEPVGLDDVGYLHVTDAVGHRVDRGAAFHPGGDGASIAARLESGMPNGDYTESYRVISADSHPVAGVIRFTVGDVAPAPAGSTGPDPGATVNAVTGAAFTVARWVFYAGLATLGGLWLLLTIWPAGWRDRRAVGLVWAGFAAVIVGALAELLLQGPYTAGAGLSAAGNLPLLRATLGTEYGYAHLARVIALVALEFLIYRAVRVVRATPPVGDASRREVAAPRWRVRAAIWVALAVVGASFSVTGHPMTTSPRWLSVGADLAHLAAMSAWVGGILMLVAVLLPRRDGAVLRATLPVVSRVAFTAVVALVVTGSYAAVRDIGSIHAVLHTNFGLLVTAKVGLLIVLMALGNLSRVAIERRVAPHGAAVAGREKAPTGQPVPVPASAAGPPAGSIPRTPPAPTGPGPSIRAGTPESASGLKPGELRRMRRSVIVEIVIAAAVLAATAVLVNQPRGTEALAMQHQQPISAAAQLGDGHTVTVTVDPGTHGAVTITVTTSAGTPVDALTATATQRDRGIGPLPISLHRTDSRHYRAAMPLPVAGAWLIELTVTESAFKAVSADASITPY